MLEVVEAVFVWMERRKEVRRTGRAGEGRGRAGIQSAQPGSDSWPVSTDRRLGWSRSIVAC